MTSGDDTYTQAVPQGDYPKPNKIFYQLNDSSLSLSIILIYLLWYNTTCLAKLLELASPVQRFHSFQASNERVEIAQMQCYVESFIAAKNESAISLEFFIECLKHIIDLAFLETLVEFLSRFTRYNSLKVSTN